jgi:hypothetical protein
MPAQLAFSGSIQLQMACNEGQTANKQSDSVECTLHHSACATGLDMLHPAADGLQIKHGKGRASLAHAA